MTYRDQAHELSRMVRQPHVEQKDVSEFVARIHQSLWSYGCSNPRLRDHRQFLMLLLARCEVDRIPHPNTITDGESGNVHLYWKNGDRSLGLWVSARGELHGMPLGTDFRDDSGEPVTFLGKARFDGVIDEMMVDDVRNLFCLVFGDDNVYVSEEEICDLCEIRPGRDGRDREVAA